MKGFQYVRFSFQLKKFIKEQCKSQEHARILRQALEKINENEKFIEDRRKKITFKFNNINEVVILFYSSNSVQKIH